MMCRESWLGTYCAAPWLLIMLGVVDLCGLKIFVELEFNLIDGKEIEYGWWIDWIVAPIYFLKKFVDKGNSV